MIEQRLGLIKSDVEDLILTGQRARILPLGDVRAEAAVLSKDIFIIKLAHHSGKREQGERFLQRHGVQGHRLEKRGRARLRLALAGTPCGRQRHLIVTDLFGDVRTKTARLGNNLTVRSGVNAQLTAVRCLRDKQLARLLHGQLIRGDVVGNGGLVQLLTLGAQLLDVRAVAAHAQDDTLADIDGVDRPGVNIAKAFHLAFEPLMLVISTPETAKVYGALLLAGGDTVEFVLHKRREVVIN